ncbi:MAG: hemerythrin domain-containing protein [Hyphomicrobiales bacterium]|nr:hemerythrin domain-containing protein [Hyphomicrobiales bacterium]
MPNQKPTVPSDCAVKDNCPVSSACAPPRAAPCEGIEERHAAKLGMCDVLESVADMLPAVDRGVCLRAAAHLLPVVREAHAFEERSLFPAFEQSRSSGKSLRRLRGEHVEDEALAEELTETLLRIGHGGNVDNPEALGFMLRTFFETMRRHVAFEREHVVPLVRSSATPETHPLPNPAESS